MTPTVLAIGLGALFTFLLAGSAWGSSSDARNGATRAAVILGGLVGAALTFGIVWEALVPGEPLAQGTLARKGDRIDVGAAGPGILSVVARPLEGTPADGKGIVARLLVKGSDTAIHPKPLFRVGDTRPTAGDEAPIKMERLEEKLSVPDLGSGVVVELIDLGPPDRISVEVAFFGRRIPFRLVAIVLSVLAVLMSLFEATAIQSAKRSFVAVTMCGAAVLAWMLQGGVTDENAVSMVLGRLLWSLLLGAIVGTLLPRLILAVMPAPRTRGKAPSNTPGLPPDDPDGV